MANSRRKARNSGFVRKDDGQKGLSDYEIDAAAVEAKTARLKAARLAKEVEDAKATVPVPAKVKSKKATPPDKQLSDWLDLQTSSGRNT